MCRRSRARYRWWRAVLSGDPTKGEPPVPGEPTDQRIRVLYLGGLGRSGTTLLERVLGEVPGIAALGEVVHLWRRDVADDERCACGERFSGCAFWKEVGERAFGGWSYVDVDRLDALAHAIERTRHIPMLSRRKVAPEALAQVREYTGYFSRLYRAAAAVAGVNVVIDSSKHSSLAFCLRLDPSIDLRVIHVVRDSRGVAYSWTKQVARPETDGTDDMTRYSPTRAAMLWNAHNAAFGLLRRRGVPVRTLQYEHFLADPRRLTRELAEFAGVRPSDTDLAFVTDGYADLGAVHSAAGNPMRFRTGRIPLQRDDEWRERLPAGQRRLVSSLTAPMLGAYGYRLFPPRSDS